MALGYDPKTSSVGVEYIGDKGNNLWYWTSEAPWPMAYPGEQNTIEFSPKGVIKYEDGTGVTTP